MAKYYKFDSGLTLLYEKNIINKSTSVEILFDCGARCDGDIPGLSHFCEHMFFTGTDKLTKQDVTKRYCDFIKSNAYTNYSDITFTGSIITKRLGDYLVAVQDMICNSTFNKEAIEEEKKIVIQEIVRDADRHSRHAGRFSAYELYGLEHYAKGVLGSVESVSSIKSKDVKNYVKKYFVKNNCVISICTSLSFNKVKNIIKTNFESVMPSNNLKPLPHMQNKLLMQEKVSVYNRDIDKSFLSVTFMFNRKGPDLKYRTEINMICNMIEDMSDGLTNALRVDNSLIYSLDADYMINNVNSYLDLSTEVGKENIKPCLDVIFDYIKNLRCNGFTKEQFDKEQEKDEYYWHTLVTTPERIQDDLLRYRFYNRFVSNKDIHMQVQALTLEDVNKTMRELFDDAKIQVFVYGNATKSDIYTIKQLQKKFN